MDNRREQIYEIVRREFIGPDPIDVPGMIQENGEEILSSDPPRIRYAAGILFPQKVKEEQISLDYDPRDFEQDEIPDVLDKPDVNAGTREYLQDAEEMMNLSNSYQQAAMSITVAVFDGDSISITVKAGKYTTVKYKDGEKEKSKYLRSSIEWSNQGLPLVLPIEKKRYPGIQIVNEHDDKEVELQLHITYRYRKNNSSVYTITLENTNVNKSSSVKDEDCFFQVEFCLHSEIGFSPLPDQEKIINDNDYLSNQLLYRNVKNYAVGHGCAADWEEKNGKVHEISTSVFPKYEIKPIVPSAIDGVSLEMYKMSDLGNENEIVDELTIMCKKYEEWIDSLAAQISEINDKGTALRHVEACKSCLSRMNNGVRLLKSNRSVLRAFQLMNRAMLLQQLHYNLPLINWVQDKEKAPYHLESSTILPDINDKSTWGDNKERYGKWRPFQLAFILMNLQSMYDETCDERSIVDLIWFPTGGGKTEAYLGLSAYTIFIRRLKNLKDSGTAIIMRYTLRLLTSQQYERASSMICSCEVIRSECPSELGDSRISIGLWVGGETSPNKMSDAVSAYNRMYNGEQSDSNPFIILKCPWCGAQMGCVAKKFTPGYTVNRVGAKKRLDLLCSNTEGKCKFSSESFKLPLFIVDEDIYSNPPTLLLGTVDKFAMLPYRPEAQTIFGIYGGNRKYAPSLIIQDELHLISGPLGSMVGHYETMIHELCTYESDKKSIKPKVIASTATISRAAEQCHALYACGKENVRQFPPSGINAGDSFFAVEDKNAAGRMYVGILASGASSIATTSIRLYAALLYAAKAIKVDAESDRDPYWTNIGYFNSIRELGQTETWIRADIDEYLHVIYKRRYEDKLEGYKENRRYIWEDKELTSRISSDKIPSTLQELGIKYPTVENAKRPVDICLATNMISVGVDVPRLGLMTVAGQPKTTSEYIQATSRVGRNSKAPGLVFTIYNPSKPRDKSHYEHFIPYHSRVYCNVEPTSVTPFSAPLRDRALHALFIGIMRLEGDKDLNTDPPKYPDQSTINRITEILLKRVEVTDPDELAQTEAHVKSLLHDWDLWEPDKYQDFTGGDDLPLMFPAGSMRNELWGKTRGFATPTSMRNVDASCEARILENGYYEEDDEYGN